MCSGGWEEGVEMGLPSLPTRASAPLGSEPASELIRPHTDLARARAPSFNNFENCVVNRNPFEGRVVCCLESTRFAAIFPRIPL